MTEAKRQTLLDRYWQCAGCLCNWNGTPTLIVVAASPTQIASAFSVSKVAANDVARFCLECSKAVKP